MQQDVLVFNVTHSDCVFLVKDGDDVVVSRPKFSFFEPLGRQALKAVIANTKPAMAPLIQDVNTTTPRAMNGRRELVVGFAFESPFECDWTRLHVRGSAVHGNDGRAQVTVCCLPLAAQIIPTWLAQVKMYAPKAHKTVLLVCGAGRPQDPQAAMSGNSTRATAELIRRFVGVFYGGEVHRCDVVDSGYDVFSYEENVRFVRQHLLPIVEQIRRAAMPAGQAWRPNMEVTLALTEGSPARLGAINAALRPYRPMSIHMWQLKTFWHEKRLIASDINIISFDRTDVTPQRPVHEQPDDVRALVAEMVRFRDEFIARQSAACELADFWLRKSHKPVLSVLLCRRAGMQHRFHRGINLEVSQPTGSLCSERNAIGSALAADVELERRDMALIAVLALPELAKPSSAAADDAKRPRSESTTDARFAIRATLNCAGTGKDLNPLGPCGACTEWLRKISDVNPDFRVVTFADMTCAEVYVREVV